MKTLFLNSVLFTLKDQAVRDNKYVLIFYTWLSKLIENGQLDKNDFLLISTDERTLEFIKTTPKCLAYLLSQLKCPYAFKIFSAPETLLDGMKIRYTPHDFKQDVFMYMDIDILVMKSLKDILYQTAHENLYVCTEGTLRDPNYGADMSATDDPGYTSALFMLTGKNIQNELFRKVHESYQDKNYYTLDQPFFNRAVYQFAHNNTVLTRVHSFNGHGWSKRDTVFLNCGGEPGNSSLHYDKIQEVLCYISVGLY
jgi:hypothetical protein